MDSTSSMATSVPNVVNPNNSVAAILQQTAAIGRAISERTTNNISAVGFENSPKPYTNIDGHVTGTTISIKV